MQLDREGKRSLGGASDSSAQGEEDPNSVHAPLGARARGHDVVMPVAGQVASEEDNPLIGFFSSIFNVGNMCCVADRKSQPQSFRFFEGVHAAPMSVCPCAACLMRAGIPWYGPLARASHPRLEPAALR